MIKNTLAARSAYAAVLALLALALVPAALAGRGGGAPKGGGSSSSLSLVMVTDGNGNGSANWGDTVTFEVSTTETSYPTVQLSCYQGGSLVYQDHAGFYDSYPWQWARNFYLGSSNWPSGAADCSAAIVVWAKNGRMQTLATLPFHVDA